MAEPRSKKTGRRLHDWTDPEPRFAKCKKCKLIRRTVVGPGYGRKMIYTKNWVTFTRKMPNCVRKKNV